MKHSKKILVIDDFAPARDYLKFLLEKEDYLVEVAVNGVEGLARFDTGGLFDAVITDIAMPEKDGIETLIELKKRDPRLKVIVVSGAESSERLLGIAGMFRADATIAKPFTQQALALALKEVFSKSVPIKEPALPV